jgi:hypothetical protein
VVHSTQELATPDAVLPAPYQLQKRHQFFLRNMNPLKYFSKIVGNPVRSDPHEGTDHLVQAHYWRGI